MDGKRGGILEGILSDFWWFYNEDIFIIYAILLENKLISYSMLCKILLILKILELWYR
jgi:hypothetical protein